MRRLLPLLVLVIATQLVACAAFGKRARSASGGGSTLAGRVTDAVTRLPVTAAVVTVTSRALFHEKSTSPRPSGAFVVAGLPPADDYAIRVEAPGYRVFARSAAVPAPGLRADVDVELLPDSVMAEEVTVTKPIVFRPDPAWGGRSAPENAYLVDGLSARDPEPMAPPPPPDPPPPPPPPADGPPAPAPEGGEARARGEGEAAPKPGYEGMKLTYEATLVLAVNDVDATLRAIEAMAKESGGYLVARVDSRLTVRVPQARFEESVRRVEPLGEVLSRAVNVQDVTDEFRDLELRLKNARGLRDRLQALLGRANVDEAIKIERELARVTDTIEQIEGRLKGLSGRIAFARIEVTCQPRARQTVAAPKRRWPEDWAWVRRLGLGPLLMNQPDE